MDEKIKNTHTPISEIELDTSVLVPFNSIRMGRTNDGNFTFALPQDVSYKLGNDDHLNLPNILHMPVTLRQDDQGKYLEVDYGLLNQYMIREQVEERFKRTMGDKSKLMPLAANALPLVVVKGGEEIVLEIGYQHFFTKKPLSNLNVEQEYGTIFYVHRSSIIKYEGEFYISKDSNFSNQKHDGSFIELEVTTDGKEYYFWGFDYEVLRDSGYLSLSDWKLVDINAHNFKLENFYKVNIIETPEEF